MKPEFPFPWMRNEDGTEVQLKQKDKFTMWWNTYGGGKNMVDSPFKESGVMSNFGESNYLSKHVVDTPALVHGMNLYKEHNPMSHVSCLSIKVWPRL